ncbi:hypothetical protein KZY98_09970 [Croceibacter atlanticus]|uniref:hypothetical protein n=1 Tax=Croceibacter atlanticus TaxID=313588 RepID=UPI001C5DF593|nr:hypothetical protein [Croceibacter atlanticus]MBW4970784.1 hypothetical protein [Croceibacter atlanticus]
MKLNRKSIFLIITFAFSIVIVYKFALSTTISERTLYESLEKKSDLNTNNTRQALFLDKKIKILDSILLEHNIASGSVQNQILDILTNTSDSLNFNLLSFSEPHKVTSEYGTITTYRFELEGQFTTLLKVLNYLETKYSIGSITHISFEKKKNYKTRDEQLQVSCFLEVQDF